MKKWFLMLPCLFMLSYTFVSAQDIEKGKWLIDQKQYNAAEKVFQSILAKNPSDSKAFYYLGKVYGVKGQLDSAEICYQQGTLTVEKFPFNFLGLGQMQLNKSNRPEWFKLYDKGRKLSEDLFNYNLEAGEVCLETKTQNYDLSEKYLDEAKKENPKDCGLITAYGNLYFASKSPGEAVNEYDRAIFYNKQCIQPYVKLGEIYAKANNYRDGISNFNQAIALDTTQILAYKERGDLYYTFGKYEEAKADYDVYMRRSDNTPEDKERYTFILFFSKNYEPAKSLVHQIIMNDTNNTVMYRVAAYIDYESGDFPSALKNIEYFFNHHDTEKFISLDYIYYGHLLLKFDQDSLGTVELENALKLDSSKTELIEEIAKSYAKQKKYINSNEYYQKMLGLNTPNQTNIYYQIGRNYYFMAEDTAIVKDTVFRAKLYHDADSCFQQMTKFSPDSYVGYIWSGRALSRLDPETSAGLAKPAYEKAMALLEAGDISKTPKLLIECYRYFAFYHYVLAENQLTSHPSEAKTEMTSSIGYWTKILNLDPSDQQAQTALENLKKM